MLYNGNPASWESENDAAISTDPSTDDYYSDSDDEFIRHCDRTDDDNDVNIKCKPETLKKDQEDLIETNKLPSMVKYIFYNPTVKDA